MQEYFSTLLYISRYVCKYNCLQKIRTGRCSSRKTQRSTIIRCGEAVIPAGWYKHEDFYGVTLFLVENVHMLAFCTITSTQQSWLWKVLENMQWMVCYNTRQKLIRQKCKIVHILSRDLLSCPLQDHAELKFWSNHQYCHIQQLQVIHGGSYPGLYRSRDKRY